MRGPSRLLRGELIDDLCHDASWYEWRDEAGELTLDGVSYCGRPGAVLCYSNPPVHQIGNPGLDAMLAALAELEGRDATFLLLTWPCDGVHAGGDLKESLTRLEGTLQERRRLEQAGAPAAEQEKLFHWADGRLDKGQALYRLVRRLSQRLRTVAVCGGGIRFGGSAEVNLMADYVVGDSRSGLCFSESMIGLIPGWAGVGRALTKAGPINSRIMAQTGRQVSAAELRRIGLYDVVVDISLPLPRKERTGDAAADKKNFQRALRDHDEAVWPQLLRAGLEVALTAEPPAPLAWDGELLEPAAQVDEEVRRRATAETYRDLWGQSLKEARGPLASLGRPLAPQSVEEVAALFRSVDAATGEDFDEDAFVTAEKEADSRLYRDPRLVEGIKATLAQTVPDFRPETRE
jgi:enoyl-CoA hydratase/carnithine racemase